MEEQSDLQGWELLPRVTDPSALDEDGGDPFGVFKADYFVLDPGSGGNEDKGLSELPDQSSVDPNPVSEQLVAGEQPDFVVDDLGEDIPLEEMNDLSWLDSWGDEIEGGKEVEAKGDVSEDWGLVASPKSVGGGEGNEIVWWKVPLELVRYYAFEARPVWSISVAAAAVVGLLMLGRRLYRMKRVDWRVPVITDGIHDKKTLHIPATAQLNEAFMVLQRMPAIRASLPTNGVTPWPAIALR